MNKLFIVFIVLVLLSNASYCQKNKIEISTDSGKIVLMLYDFTPKNTENMVKLAKQHYYDSTMFHRVIPQFMIQGGDSTSKHAKPGQPLGMGGLGYTVPAEISDSAFHKRGALAVARTMTPDKSGSACQFYIVVGKKCSDAELDNIAKQKGIHYTTAQKEIYKSIGGTPHLDGDYTVFGEVIEGMDVVDKIATTAADRANRPKTDIRMLTVRLIEPEIAKKKKRGFFSFLRWRHKTK